MKIIKRNGSEVDFDVSKIVNAITKASNACESASLTDEQIHDISDFVEYKCHKMNRAVSVEEIQDMVENQIMATGAFEIARRYFTHMGPATIHDAMYYTGAKQAEVKNWLKILPVESFDYEGKTYYYIPNGKSYDKEIPPCIFLAGFDQLMLGYQKKESIYLSQEHLRGIFNLAGIVMPSILLNGKVVGKWRKKNSKLTITLFETVDEKDQKIISNNAENLWDEILKITFE